MVARPPRCASTRPRCSQSSSCGRTGQPAPGSHTPASSRVSCRAKGLTASGCRLMDVAARLRRSGSKFQPSGTCQDRNGGKTHRVLPSQSHPHEKIVNPSPSPSPCAGLVFCPSPRTIGFRGTHGEPTIKSKYLNKHSGNKE